MNHSTRTRGLLGRSLMLTAMLWVGSAGAADPACDRTCLSRLADRFLASVAARRPADLPLAPVYKATENGVAAGIPMMNPWTTATGIGSRYYDGKLQGQYLLLHLGPPGAHSPWVDTAH